MLNTVLIYLTNFAAPLDQCTLPRSKFGIPTWYKYIPGKRDPVTNKCQLPVEFKEAQIPKLAAATVGIVEILLVVAGMVAVVYIVYGGFRYVTSMGEPENTKAAKDTILNAVIGLVLTIIATTIVRFIGTKL